ncbi:MAG: NFACT family protein [Candidatus Woesearchaeota archaeon]|nr:MAG: NFACT family protein [Candidatus Woesearchaeota archaeon]
MQLTGVDLSFLSREFQELVGAKLEKIYQSDEVFLFRFYVPAGGKRELKISLPGSIYYTSYAVVFPREPPKFCQFLRKYLQGGKITRVYQKPFERIIELSFSRKDGNFHLIIELFHDGNIVLCHEDYKIKGLYKSQRFSSRSVRGGVTYEYPPLKFDFTLLEQTPFPKDDLERFLAGTLGLGKVWAKELAHGGSEKEIKEKIESFSSCRIEANASNGIPLPLNFETLPCEKTFATFNEAVDDLFSTKEVKIKQEAQEGSVHSREDKIERTLSSQVDALEKNEEDAVLNNKKGELIFTHQPELEQLFAAFHELRKSLAGKNLEAELKKRFAFVSSFDQKNGTITVEFEA